MRTADFDFDLPPDLIARRPAPARDQALLMRVGRGNGSVSHHIFSDLPQLLQPGDLLVLNDTRVVPARIRAVKPRTGGRVDLLLLEPEGGGRWRVMVKGSLRTGETVHLEGGLAAEVAVAPVDGFAALAFGEADVAAHLERHGTVPLPPYIKRPADTRDRDDYQTVFARHPGSVAAPTSGLHFTPAVLEGLEARGVDTTRITLHVGPGTFLPVRSERAEDHAMLPERYRIPEAAAAAVAAARERGGRVIACGTTVTRALEAAADGIDGPPVPGEGSATLFIRPGHRFRVVEGLVTNFHLPRSTLLMLVAAFAGRERVLAAYAEAVARHYRFYSYGDAMLIL